MGKSRAPSPPDPQETAGAQTAQNIGTAIAQQSMNNINQVTPDGSLTYRQTGTTRWRDPNTGDYHEIPRYTATQTLSPQQRRLHSISGDAEINMATLARDQSARLGDLLGAPVDINNESTEARLMELGRSRLDPALERRRETLRTTLSNQGIKEGSEAFDRAMARNSESENDAYNQLLLTGRGQAVQEALAERNQPVNEISALMSGSQVSQPQFVSTNPAQIANVDRAGLEHAAYQGELANWQQRQQQRSAAMGGLFGLGARAITGGVF